MRYGIIANSIVSMIESFVTGLSTQSCFAILSVMSWTSTISSTCVSFIMALRTCALYNANSTVVKLVKTAALANIIMSLSQEAGLSFYMHDSFSAPLGNLSCLQRFSLSSQIVLVSDLGLANVAWYESVNFVLTVTVCARLLRLKQTKLVWTIFKDSVAYFFLLTVLTVLSLVTFTTLLETQPALSGTFPVLICGFQAVLCSRILIRLRQTASELGDPTCLIQNLSVHIPSAPQLDADLELGHIEGGSGFDVD